MGYVAFKQVPIGKAFGHTEQCWIKRSSRTAYHVTAKRVFYFRQVDTVFYNR